MPSSHFELKESQRSNNLPLSAATHWFVIIPTLFSSMIFLMKLSCYLEQIYSEIKHKGSHFETNYKMPILIMIKKYSKWAQNCSFQLIFYLSLS